MPQLYRPLSLPDAHATEALAARFAPDLGPGDALLLSGAIGAGKTAFARALIQHRLGRAEDVPSPTFTLVQTYDAPATSQAPACEIWHADLYRATGPGDVIELGLEDAFAQAVCLVEWPDRLQDMAPPGALTITLTAGSPHIAAFSGPREWASRLERLLA